MNLINMAIARVVTLHYLLALGLIACLSTGSYLSLSLTTAAEDRRAELLREIARQNATGQRIAFFANAYAIDRSADARTRHRRELARAVADMGRAHQRMVRPSAEDDFNAIDEARVRQFFLSGLNPFDAQIDWFLEHARTITELPDHQVVIDHPSLEAVNRAATTSIPQGYRLMSDILKKESERTIALLGRIEIGAWLATLALLLLEGLFIFRPLARRVRETVAGLSAAEANAREAAASAQAAMQSRSRFFATMSHEIRTPLNAVIGATGLLLGTRLDERQEGYVRMARGAGEHLLGLVNDILDLSKLESGKLDLDSGEFSLAREVDRVVAMIEPDAAAKALTLEVKCDPRADAAVMGDSRRIRQVLVNLVGNAVKFTPRGSVTISVGLTADAPSRLAAGDTANFEIRVSDTGIGIAESDMPRLFVDFEQLDSGTSRRFDGTGLGLAISRRIVELMGGRIGVESALGRGSTFWFTVPLEVITPERANASPEPDASSSAPLSVLVAEDNSPNQLILRHLLESFGHSVTVAQNGQQAVDEARRTRFDLVLMDVEMPVLDGVEAMRCIREMDGEMSAVPIIALTAHAREDLHDARFENGFSGYLSKPIDPAALIEAMASAVPSQAAAGVETQREPLLFNAETFHRLSKVASSPETDELVGCLTASFNSTLEMMRTACGREDADTLRSLASALAEAAEAVGGERLAEVAGFVARASDPVAAFRRNSDFLSGYGRETGREIELAHRRQPSGGPDKTGAVGHACGVVART